jgi:hypothetical protein
MDMDEEENHTNESPTSSIESLLLVINTPERCKYYLPLPEEGRASNDYKRKRVTMYLSNVHTDIMLMVPQCTMTTWTHKMLSTLQRRRLGYSTNTSSAA